MHKLLERQLRKSGLELTSTPDDYSAWAEFLVRIEQVITSTDQRRYLLERSIQVSSDEMQALHLKVQKTNDELNEQNLLLRKRNSEMTALNQLGFALQACKNISEVTKVIEEILPVLFPETTGQFTVFDSAAKHFEIIAAWGDNPNELTASSLTQNNCLALSSPSPHFRISEDSKEICDHLPKIGTDGFACVPLFSQGLPLGSVHIQWSGDCFGYKDNPAEFEAFQALFLVVTKSISLTTSNLFLQKSVGEREGHLLEAERDLKEVLYAVAGLEGRYTGFLAGKYRLGAVIGQGGMGEVYAATCGESGDQAAVKLIRFDSSGDLTHLSRFLREGEIGMNLNVSNVVRVFELGNVVQFGEEGQLMHPIPYIVMELLIGEDLRVLLRRERKLSLARCVKVCQQVATGIAAAHRAGIVHRDLKPQNLFLHQDGIKSDGEWKVLDFGVSTLGAGSGTLTQGAIVGTPAYMAPEQARSEEVDNQCDVYSLGAVLYRALTGTPPFSGASPAQILYEVEYRVPTRPSQVLRGIPPGVDAVLAIALAKSRADRFESMDQLSEAFSEAAAGELSLRWKKKAALILSRHPWGKQIHSLPYNLQIPQAKMNCDQETIVLDRKIKTEDI